MSISDANFYKLLEDVDFYVDATDRSKVYVQYKKDGDSVYFNTYDSEDFKACLRIWYRDLAATSKPLNVTEVLQRISDENLYYGNFEEVEPHTRVAGSLNSFLEYSLADRANHIVEVSNGTWKIKTTSDYHFLTPSSQKSQVIPQATTTPLVDLLAPIVNLKGDDLTLFAIWLTQCFSGGAHYGMMLSAARGSAKSTLTRLINAIVDPSRASVMQLQNKLQDFQDVLASNYLCCYDNLRAIPTDYSDTLSAAITGSTVAKRVLFTTNTIIYMKLLNVIVLNGIDLFPPETDLAERFLYFELKKLSRDNLKPDGEIDKLFRDSRPYILGAIFDLLAKATVTIHETVNIKPTRMATSFCEMLSIAKAMGISEKEFDRLIRENIERLQNACADTPLVQAIVEYMNGPSFGTRKVTLSSTEFYTRVRNNYSGQKTALPSSAAAFSKRLKAEHDALQRAGFSSIVDDTGAASSTITIIREKK